jgi:catechol 2,3-dioxygenase-like lactoylglutathione lyase family enzyme
MQKFHVESLDHLVLTVADIGDPVRFYTEVLGMREVTFGAGRKALAFGRQKINLHQAGREIAPYAGHPTRGSADLCLLTKTPMEEVIVALRAMNVQCSEHPLERTGACGPLRSVYLRDPDGNLIEISNEISGS